MKRYGICLAVILLIIFSSCTWKNDKSSTIPQTTASQSETENAVKQPQKPAGTAVDNGSSIGQNVKEPKVVMGLVRIDDLDPNIIIDLKYATTNNFTGRQIYNVNICALTESTAQKLIRANSDFMKDGYRIKIWDSYRPLYVQQIFWDIVKNPQYVADPKYGSSHSTGCTVDITLVDKSGKELIMPTGFDDFSVKASRKFEGSSKEAKNNLEYLTEVMRRNGFTTINSEWWEFRDTDISKYSELDVRLEEFM